MRIIKYIMTRTNNEPKEITMSIIKYKYIITACVTALLTGAFTAHAAIWTGGGSGNDVATQGNWDTTFNYTGAGYTGFSTGATIGSGVTATSSITDFRLNTGNLTLTENATFTGTKTTYSMRINAGDLVLGTTTNGGNVFNVGQGSQMFISGGINTTGAVGTGKPKNQVNINGGVLAKVGGAAANWGSLANQTWSVNGTSSTIWLYSGTGNLALQSAIQLNAGLKLRNDAAGKVLIVYGPMTGTGGVLTQSGISQFGTGSYGASGTVQVDSGSEFRTGAGGVFTGAGQSAAVNVDGLFSMNATGRDQTIGALSGTGTVSMYAVSGAPTLTANSDGSTSTFAGNFTNNGTLRLNNAASKLTLTGNSSAFTGNAAVDAGTLLVKNTFGATNVSVGASGLIGGNSTISGDLDFAAGGKIVFSATDTLTVGGTVTFDGFSVADVYGLDGTVADGIYTLIDGTVDFANVSNVGIGNAYSIGGGKSAYFQSGSLDLVVIPEPSTITLFMISCAGALLIRRWRG